MFAYIDRFNRYAVKYELSAAAILFWQYLCFTMAQKNQFERLQQDTAALMQALQITRQGLIGVRKSLERVGLLAVERDENQKLWYTLQLDGKALQPVGKAAKQAEKEPFHGKATPVETEPLCEETQQTAEEWSGIQSGAVCGQQCSTFANDDHPQTEQETGVDEKANCPAIATMQPVAQKKVVLVDSDNAVATALKAEKRRADCLLSLGFVSDESRNSVQPIMFPDKPGPASDIVMSREYPVYLKAFCSRYDDSSLHSNLTSWMQQREQNGWTLTLWGLEELLKKLVQLAAGQAKTMAAIVKQSIKRRWKGFHALKAQSRPSGEKLLKLEEKEQRAYEKAHPKQPAIVRKLFGTGEATDEDLSFLEE